MSDQEPHWEPRYKVSLLAVLNRLGLDTLVLEEHDTLELHLTGGAGNYKVKRWGTNDRTSMSGGMEENFDYHPNGFCEGSGVCEWCGRALL